MSLNFSTNENGDSIAADFSDDPNTLRAVGRYYATDCVKVQVDKRVKEINLISGALRCLEAFYNGDGLTADLVLLRATREFEDRYQMFVNEYTYLGFNMKELEILTYVHFSKLREWSRMAAAVRGGESEFMETQMKIPHRPAPPPPPPGFSTTASPRGVISRPTVPPPPPPSTTVGSDTQQLSEQEASVRPQQQPSVRPKVRPRPAAEQEAEAAQPQPPPSIRPRTRPMTDQGVGGMGIGIQ